ncbi:hypothetical protein L210DRAFT_2588006 [Boletus edulis BED1]|uniref:Uncharacterized protein n=1 Tax=Boletus edulis BED1 TaxID=1328754 RepID=A0AAD4GBG2_BOLED|nr:hypothetical protein L210DRAFT_2588006 [Boletus edulis BED1]
MAITSLRSVSLSPIPPSFLDPETLFEYIFSIANLDLDSCVSCNTISIWCLVQLLVWAMELLFPRFRPQGEDTIQDLVILRVASSIHWQQNDSCISDGNLPPGAVKTSEGTPSFVGNVGGGAPPVRPWTRISKINPISLTIPPIRGNFLLSKRHTRQLKDQQDIVAGNVLFKMVSFGHPSHSFPQSSQLSSNLRRSSIFFWIFTKSHPSSHSMSLH